MLLVLIFQIGLAIGWTNAGGEFELLKPSLTRIEFRQILFGAKLKWVTHKRIEMGVNASYILPFSGNKKSYPYLGGGIFLDRGTEKTANHWGQIVEEPYNDFGIKGLLGISFSLMKNIILRAETYSYLKIRDFADNGHEIDFSIGTNFFEIYLTFLVYQ